MLPKIVREGSDTRVIVGDQPYLMEVPQTELIQAFNLAWPIACQLVHDNKNASVVSEDEITELRQLLILEALYFRSVNEHPLELNETSFDDYDVVSVLAERLRGECANTADLVRKISSITDVTESEIQRILGNIEARERIHG